MSPRYKKSRIKSDSSLKGDAAHSLARRWIEDKVIQPAVDVIGTVAANGVVYTMALYESAAIYTATALDIMRGATYAGCEDSITCVAIHDRCKGDVDVWAYHAKTETLTIGDFKNGFSPVSPFENWQEATYAIGLLSFLRRKNKPVSKIRFVIIQPNSFTSEGPVKEWETTPDWVDARCEVMQLQAIIASGENPPCRPAAHCRNCNGRHACTALKASTENVVSIVHDSTPWELTPDELSVELSVLQTCKELLSARLSGLEAEALSLCKAGKMVPGYALARGRGSVKWVLPPEETLAVAQVSGYDVSKPAQVITPKQAKDAGVPKDFVDGLSERTQGSIKLVKDDCSEAKLIFSKEK